MAILVPAIIGKVFGYLAFRSRIKGVRHPDAGLSPDGASLMFFRNDMLMGGRHAVFTDFKSILGADIRSAGTQRTLDIATRLSAEWRSTSASPLAHPRRISASSNAPSATPETRVLLGDAAANYKLFVFAGLWQPSLRSQAPFYVPQVGIINPKRK